MMIATRYNDSAVGKNILVSTLEEGIQFIGKQNGCIFEAVESKQKGYKWAKGRELWKKMDRFYNAKNFQGARKYYGI